jgi:hypothetical protein
MGAANRLIDGERQKGKCKARKVKARTLDEPKAKSVAADSVMTESKVDQSVGTTHGIPIKAYMYAAMLRGGNASIQTSPQTSHLPELWKGQVN